MTNEQIIELIGVNIPDNSQQLVTPQRVRQVLLEMQGFANVLRQSGDALMGVLERGNTSTIPVQFVGIDTPLQFAHQPSPMEYVIGDLRQVVSGLTENRTWYLPDETGTLATREWVAANAGGGGGTVSWGGILGTLSAQTDLAAALAGKAATSHSHAVADVTGLQTALDGKAAVSHTHSIANVTGLQTALDGKQAAGSYAAASHTHTVANITDFPSQTGQSGKYLSTNGTTLSWETVAGGGGVTTMAAVGSSPNANGASISGVTLTLQPASATHPGVVTTGAQAFAGVKSFASTVVFANAGPSLYLLDGGAAARTGISNFGSRLDFFTANSGSFLWYFGGEHVAGVVTPTMSLTTSQLSLASGIAFSLASSFLTLNNANGTLSESIILQNGANGSRTIVGKFGGDMHFIVPSDKAWAWYGDGESIWLPSAPRMYLNAAGLHVLPSNFTAMPASAALSVTSTTRGFLPPRMTTTQRNAIASPATGLMVYDNDILSPYMHNGSGWGKVLVQNHNGQVVVNSDSPTMNASAQFQINSTTRGFLPPRMTTTERNAIGSPAAGLQIYNLTTQTMQFYDGTNWISM